MQSAEQFYDTISNEVEKDFRRKRLFVEVKYATIDPAYTSGRPRVTYDGESSLALRPHAYLGTYTPQAGDRVQIVNGVIQGDIR